MQEFVLEVGGLLRGSSVSALKTFLRRQPDIHLVEAAHPSDTLTVGYDETAVSEARICPLIEQCG